MDFQLAFMIIITSIIIFFIEEISNICKGFWNNAFLKHTGLMLVFGFFGLSYYAIIAGLFQSIIHQTNSMAATFSPYIPFFQNKHLIIFVLCLIFLSTACASLFSLCYFIVKNKSHQNYLFVLWAVWLVVGTVYLVT